MYIKPKNMPEPLIKIAFLTQGLYFGRSYFFIFLDQLIEQFDFFLLDWIFLEKVIVKSVKFWLFGKFDWLDEGVADFAFDCAYDFKMKRPLSFRTQVTGNGKAFPLVSLDKLILEDLKSMYERLIIFFKALDLLMKRLGLRLVSIKIFE